MALPFLKLVSVLAGHSLRAMRRPSIQLWSKTLELHAGEPQLAGSSSNLQEVDESYSRPSTYYHRVYLTWCDGL